MPVLCADIIYSYVLLVGSSTIASVARSIRISAVAESLNAQGENYLCEIPAVVGSSPRQSRQCASFAVFWAQEGRSHIWNKYRLNLFSQLAAILTNLVAASR